MKRNIVALAMLTAILLSSCGTDREVRYSFRQEFAQITSIEIAYAEDGYSDINDAMQVIKTIDPSEHRAIVDAILKISGNRVTPPGSSFGVHIIIITYVNGEKELIGNYNNGYITPEGKLKKDRYRLNRDEFYELVSFYIGEKVTEPYGWGT